jgi:hypothetical protein
VALSRPRPCDSYFQALDRAADVRRTDTRIFLGPSRPPSVPVDPLPTEGLADPLDRCFIFRNRPLLLSPSQGKAHVCTNPNPNLKVIRQGVSRSIDSIEEQIKLLALRLLRAQVRLKELQAERREAWKKYPK